MTPPLPVICRPLLQPRPWGGRALATLLNKELPPGVPVGESWELASLPGAETCVRDGPLAGTPLGTLVEQWGAALLGSAPRCADRFPLLIKFLDARETLSVQVHPRPRVGAGAAAEFKDEAWYIVQAAPRAQLYLGLRSGVTHAAVAAALRTGTPRWDELLQVWPADAGDCFYLPAGTPHALGAGLVVAEVQTPCDVTYRLHDWGRVGLDGRPRTLHVAEALANLRDDVPEAVLRPAPQPAEDSFGTATRAVTSQGFTIDRVTWGDAGARRIDVREMRVWIVLAGRGKLVSAGGTCGFQQGDVVLLPAALGATDVTLRPAGSLLEVRVPTSVTSPTS